MAPSSPAASQREELLPDQAAFFAACRDEGFADTPDHNHPEASGVGPVPLNNPNGIRWSTALGYLDPARHRLNLTIRPNCLTRRVIFDGKKAVGVEVESGGERFTVEGEQIVLSSGAIGSPQILLLSGVGPARHLDQLSIPVVHDLPGVGQKPPRPSHDLHHLPHQARVPAGRLRPPRPDDPPLDRRGLRSAQRHDDLHAVLRH